jgi:hypothetical protein
MRKMLATLTVVSAICLSGAFYELKAGSENPPCSQPPTQCWADSSCAIAGSPTCTCQYNYCWPWQSCPNQCISGS